MVPISRPCPCPLLTDAICYLADLELLSESLRAELKEANIKLDEAKKVKEQLELAIERERALEKSHKNLEDR